MIGSAKTGWEPADPLPLAWYVRAPIGEPGWDVPLILTKCSENDEYVDDSFRSFRVIGSATNVRRRLEMVYGYRSKPFCSHDCECQILCHPTCWCAWEAV